MTLNVFDRLCRHAAGFVGAAMRPRPLARGAAPRGVAASTPARSGAVAPPLPALMTDHDATIDDEFTALLFGMDGLRDGDASDAEQALLARLDAAAQAGDDVALVPRLATALPKLMHLLRREDASAAELVALLGHEPALLGEVIRVAHSPRYGRGRRADDLIAAVALLGQRGMQEVVLRAVMAPVYTLAKGRHRAAGQLLWEHAEGCACACASLIRGAADRFDAYLAGMVANTGLIVALRLLDLEPRLQWPVSRNFCDALSARSARLSARIARQWELPPEVALAVGSLGHAGPGGAPAAVPDLAAALRVADRSSKARLLARQGIEPGAAPHAR